MQALHNSIRAAIGVLSVAAVVSVASASFAAPKSFHSSQGMVTAQGNQAGTIVDVASKNSSFSTLVKALKAAGLVETLSGQGPYTVFAPTNAAFAALPKGTLDKLLKPENKETLQKVLTYHVVSGNLKSSSLKSGDVTTVEGASAKVNVSNGRVRVNNATVTKADISASNGVIHVIDKVLLPPDVSLK
ncbi:fasciclin domain-containing protein [Iningainema tapete]|uniref:Fasciclin domain-containing protein n=1 Tax=Iningainema tapete BLCC-T55 TaxID=2748662 RepID=A0A8J7CAH1_9CYAN|nr:fasciclin domain-containing protein [Iningainema tapete]MBD2777121.1 fasciclin domain-containing protein [Iningainema tapete BLCC-T55]